MQTDQLPNFIKREVEKLEEMVTPQMKRASKFTFWSFPLIIISIINLFPLVLLMANTNDNILVPVLFYSVIGALGMALSKEARLQQKEVQKMSSEYVISRIKRSHKAPESIKQKYISLISTQPIKTMSLFVSFLKEEDRFSYSDYQA